MESIFGFELLGLLIPPTLRPDALKIDMSLQERLVGRADANMLGVIPYYTTLLAIVAALISTFYVIYAGYIMFTAFGDESKYATGKKTLLYAVIGFAISMSAYFLVRVFAGALGYTGTY